MIQTFEFYGSGRQINAQGRFFRYETGADGSGQTDIALTIDGNRIGVLQPGDDIELPQEAQRWDIAPVSSGCTGKVRIGNARITSQKLQGIVQTVDAGLQRSQTGQAFVSNEFTIAAAGAGFFTHCQLFNRSTSKTAYVKSIRASSAAATQIRFHFTPFEHTAPRDMYSSPAKSASVAAGTSAAGYSAKYITSVVNPDLPTPVPLWVLAVPANGRDEKTFIDPLVLPPGFGLVGVCMTANIPVSIGFEWHEA